MTTPQVGISFAHPTVPFMTAAMYRKHPTGIPVDNLVTRGNPQQNEAELERFIRQASSEMNSYCYGATGGVLTATVDTQAIRTRIDRHGNFNLNPPFLPILALESFAFGEDPSSMTDLTDLTRVQMERFRIVVPAYGFLGMSSAGPLQFGAAPAAANYPLWVNYQYANGWPLTYLSETVDKDAVSFTVDDPTGIYAGLTTLVMRDPAGSDEYVPVTGVTGNTITCAPLQQAHTVANGAVIQVDALHEDLVTACGEITTGMLKRRAQGMAGGTKAKAEDVSPGDDNFAAGFDCLRDFVQTRWR